MKANRCGKIWDVLVVGGGPGGSIAAKICADAGLKTLLVEKKKLPREKTCTGMMVGYWAKNLIKEQFGDIPAVVLADVRHFNGVMLHVGSEKPVEIPAFIPVGWRKNLDYWMVRKAMEAGVRLSDSTRARAVRKHETGHATAHETVYEVELKGEGKEIEKVHTKFLIGADGAFSVVRKFVCPGMTVRYRPAYRECYQEDVSIEKDRFHWFFPLMTDSPRFDVHYKDGFFLVEGGSIRKIRNEIVQLLGAYGFSPHAKPLWRDGCVIAELHEALLNGSFLPANENAVLVGDAAGMILPFTYEGIGSALKSGSLAAESIVEAIQGRSKADHLYLRKMEGVIKVIKELRLLQLGIGPRAKGGADAASVAMKEIIEKTVSEDFGAT